MTKCKYIDDYIAAIGSGTIPASKEIKQAVVYIESKLDDSDVFVDTEKTEKAKELIERYFNMKLFDWELFVLALVHCYYRSTDTVVFGEFLIMMGRGNGKNGFISGVAWYLSTKYHGVDGYNVDIIANSEDQAKTSFDDIYEMLERTWEKSKRFFYKSKEIIRNSNTGSYIKFNTSNAKTKDGKRSACLIFDEIHEYENSDTIKVFRSGFGKRKHSRTFYITTNGYVRDGVLDDRLQIAHDVLNGEIKQSRLCPLIYKMDDDAEVDDKTLWVKANPSLPYLPTLQLEMEQNYIDKEYDTSVSLDFYTKRMNLPRSDKEIAVTDWENIAATNLELPDMEGWTCTCGIDYAKINDWASVNLHFRRGNERLDINHSWLCIRSADLQRIKAPWREWVGMGLVTIVDDVEISPDLLADYIREQMQKYYIVKIAMDNNRFDLMKRAMRKVGFAPEYKNLWLVRPSDIYKVQPVIGSCFNNRYFAWGDCPPLRWATNNTKLVRRGRVDGTDTGNFYYAKIEAKSRKTDPFMALVASMVIEDALGDGMGYGELTNLGVITG
ncbi:terminase large subunit [Agathobaculum sp. NTUH-O15-33]|uniref:terminase large subunit domain-containing protein n=1 Tax=Agathobaculum sp. NTUH-O15-33 TaxID=3079302 RepID=UPI002958B77D|nr:terminase large subunit [Agathobaculum sp. NTUH-O15-33]WNX85246.1 terminase large subunit [Agathobaculum sp. NTUH-O15-33]